MTELTGMQQAALAAIRNEATRVAFELDGFWRGIDSPLPSARLADEMGKHLPTPRGIIAAIRAWADEEGNHDYLLADLSDLSSDCRKFGQLVGWRS